MVRHVLSVNRAHTDWFRDQEMRFIVHDSPDYYQLKVSVFNDDKKTELIGETWIALDQIIMPGGGKNDAWHNLNCKGRYAGEIRIELTYYDNRPKEDKADDRRQSATNNAIEQGNSPIGGPRQPKPVKRRPLPANPTDSPRSSPLPQTPPSVRHHMPSPQQRYVDSPDDFGYESAPPPDRRHQRLHDGHSRGSPLSKNSHQTYEGGNMVTAPSPDGLETGEFNHHDPTAQHDYRHENALPLSQSPQNEPPYDQEFDYNTEDPDDWQSRPLAQPLQASYEIGHSNSSPAAIDARPRQNTLPVQQYNRSSPPKSSSYDDSLAYQNVQEDGYEAWENPNENHIHEQETPPPPPAHRNGGLSSSPQPLARTQPEQYGPIPATAPLNIRNGRGSLTNSPLSKVQSNSSYMTYAPSPSPSNSYSNSQPAPSVSSRTSFSQIASNPSHSPVRDYEQSMPPSLVPGYEPSIAEDESERIMHEKRMSARQQYSDQPAPQYQQAPAPITQSRQQPLPRNIENAQRRPHRSSAPQMNPHAVSPSPRTPVRKSVSPQPGSTSNERRPSEIPFSPDSYDAFNPSISTANSVNQPGARYNTPEQAIEASRQHERDLKLGDGPIIGNDGRIIDPSDHLPTDTWAPEPEQKAPRRGPEVTVRFKHSPQGAQPMPSAAKRPLAEARPHSVSTPAYYAHGSEGPSLASTSQARLKKQDRILAAQTASSPIVPTVNTAPRNPMTRKSGSDYPLREHENYGGYGNGSTYGRFPPGNVPPPIPGKIPIGSGQEDWGMNALSEEMRQIDIGVGGKQGRARRSKFGP